MDPAFWHARWREGKIGFHQPHVNRYLVRYWQRLAVPVGERVLVPLCGKSLDVGWIVAQGCPVVGVEFDGRAVRAFFAERGWTATVAEQDGIKTYSANDVRILRADIHALRPHHVGAIAAVYDRAALGALPAQARPGYVQQISRLAPRAPMLLVSLEYKQHEMDGPPFSVSEDEVHALYAQQMRIERLVREDVLGEHERFRNKGLTQLHESVFLLRAREP